MQIVQYFANQSVGCTSKAVLPRVGQAKATVTAGSGSAITPLFTSLTPGQLPYAAGQIDNRGCAELQLTITYLGGSDCDACTQDTLTATPVTLTVPGGTVFPLPDGLVSAISFQTGSTDPTGVFTPSNATKAQTIRWYSYYTPCCDQVLVP
ncbi:MAG: hypothetical protein ACRDBG_07200 [Waterburya sp.]